MESLIALVALVALAVPVLVVVLLVKVSRLTDRVTALEKALLAPKTAESEAPRQEAPVRQEEAKEATAGYALAAKAQDADARLISKARETLQPQKTEGSEQVAGARESEPDKPEQSRLSDLALQSENSTVAALMRFIKGGNAWAAIGVILIVIGIAFGYTYIATHYNVPAESKVASGTLFGLALFIVAFRKRAVKPNFALIAQGGGIGVMYLSFFSAYKIYKILPFEIVFVLVIVLVIMGALMAAIQDSEAMAFFTTVIGFAAPVLLSTGSNNYIGLFSFYTVLNLAVLAAALKKYWRYLNGAGFFCTYTVGFTWGAKYYENENFLHILIFATAFFLIYTAINILSARKRHSPRIENVFSVATPFAYMAILMYIGKAYEYGQSISAFCVGIFYFILCLWLKRRQEENLKHLFLLYLPLGLITLNFSVPLALPGDWTAGIWAAEGAMLTALGVHQKNRFFRWFGVILILGAAVAMPLRFSSGGYPYLNSIFITGVIVALSALVSAFSFRILHVKAEAGSFLRKEGAALSYLMLLTGVVIWYRNTIFEADRGDIDIYFDTLFFISVNLSAMLFAYVGKRFSWRAPQLLAFTPAILAFFLILRSSHFVAGFYFADFNSNIFSYNAIWAGWLTFSVAQGFLFYLYRALNAKTIPVHAVSILALVSVIALNLNYPFDKYIIADAFYSYGLMATALVAIFMLFVIGRKPLAAGHPLKDAYEVWRLYGCGLLAVALIIDNLLCFSTDIYQNKDQALCLPLFNTPDAVSLMALAVSVYWLVYLMRARRIAGAFQKVCAVVIIAAILVWLHAAAGRGVAYFLYYEYNYYYSTSHYIAWLLSVPAYQTAMSIIWAVAGLCLMVYGNKRLHKFYWILGACLLGADGLKLFLVDLSKAGTLARVGSFISVGLIFLIIGYFLPMPKGKAQKAIEKSGE